MAPGAWEIMKMRRERVLVCIITPPELKHSRWWCQAFRAMQVPPGSAFKYVEGFPYDAARNVGLKDMIDSQFGHIAFWDSIPGESPLLVKDKETQEFDILPIEDLAQFSGKNGVVERVTTDRWQAYIGHASKNWSDIRQVIRHPFHGFLRTIRTGRGLLRVSGNHSVFIQNHGGLGNTGLADASTIAEGDVMAMPVLSPHPYYRRNFFLGREDLAWLYGFFAAEGSVTHGNHGEYSGIKVSNTDEELLDFAREVLHDYFNRPFHKGMEPATPESKAMYYLEATDTALGSFLRRMFYTSAGQKKVPRVVLNSPTGIKIAFLRGYSAGDGTHTNAPPGGVEQNIAFHRFTTVSPTLAQGVMFLVGCAGLEFSLYNKLVKDGRQRVYEIGVIKTRRKEARREAARVLSALEEPFDGYLYDISTEEERFVGGVGGFLLHNSDILPPADTIPRLIETGRDLIGALYTRRGPPFDIVAGRATHDKDGKHTGFKMPPYNQGDIVPVDVLGMGMTLISRRCVQAIMAAHPRPFAWGLDLESVREESGALIPRTSEDFVFCLRSAECGYQPWVHTGITARHELLAVATPGGVAMP